MSNDFSHSAPIASAAKFYKEWQAKQSAKGKNDNSKPNKKK
ncbi:hypothetical protein [Persicobacter psychrovividus]|uniref:Uncharacterized protein n=1 Tax=Persicobacter psychrovividus TaxID=387638 RepID=A0ABN6L7D4_9BACT|nr:hypothetical protein PEPS_14170 [Persicobacter psychrovividus]